MNCPKCGCAVNDDAMFCPACGADVSVVESNPFAVGSQEPTSSGRRRGGGGSGSVKPGFFGAFAVCMKKAFDWSGRASRREYWFFNIISAVIMYSPAIVGVLMSGDSGTPAPGFTALSGLFVLVFVFPLLAVQVRRLHDTSRSAWNLLWGCIPYIGGIILFVFDILPGHPVTNDYGPAPR